jgi:hypothetical protein
MGLEGSVPPFVELRRGPVRDFSDSLRKEVLGSSQASPSYRRRLLASLLVPPPRAPQDPFFANRVVRARESVTSPYSTYRVKPSGGVDGSAAATARTPRALRRQG